MRSLALMSIALLSSTGGELAALRLARDSSISSTMRSASSPWPWVTIQRGLSGMCRRSQMMTRPSTGPMKNAMRQPTFSATWSVSSSQKLAKAPSSAPAQ